MDPSAKVEVVEDQGRKMHDGIAIVGATPRVFVIDGLAPLDEVDCANAGRSEIDHVNAALG